MFPEFRCAVAWRRTSFTTAGRVTESRAGAAGGGWVAVCSFIDDSSGEMLSDSARQIRHGLLQ